MWLLVSAQAVILGLWDRVCVGLHTHSVEFAWDPLSFILYPSPTSNQSINQSINLSLKHFFSNILQKQWFPDHHSAFIDWGSYMQAKCQPLKGHKIVRDIILTPKAAKWGWHRLQKLKQWECSCRDCTTSYKVTAERIALGKHPENFQHWLGDVYMMEKDFSTEWGQHVWVTRYMWHDMAYLETQTVPSAGNGGQENHVISDNGKLTAFQDKQSQY